MENIFRNDLKEGNKTILKLVDHFRTPLRQRVVSQAIFQHTYPTFFRKESFSTIALLSLYLAGKVTENVIKLHTFIDVGKVKIPKEKLVELECRMVEMLNFNFDIVPAHFYLFRISKSLNLDITDKLQILDEVHGDSRLNYINYFNGIYEPLVVALSLIDDSHIKTLECVYSLKIDMGMINEVRRVLLKK
ncbi:hypothetical protein NGRA_1131 [Nosema granulosis]|uniref:Uncharacterized protein n=1 Tax=Nosema granulosis TaxID=83296 RepID=A0A9P6GZL2_9MICR|nr:hypothetical protein NGRA_1131 [Nosema granulosis]